MTDNASDIHETRPHKGQIDVARRFRSLLHSDTYPSEISGEQLTLLYFCMFCGFMNFIHHSGSESEFIPGGGRGESNI